MMESCGTNWPSSAAPSVTIVRAPLATDFNHVARAAELAAREALDVDAAAGLSLTSLAARSALNGDGWLGACPSPQRSTTAWARAPMAGMKTPAAPAASVAAVKARLVILVMAFSRVAGPGSGGAAPGSRLYMPMALARELAMWASTASTAAAGSRASKASRMRRCSCITETRRLSRMRTRSSRMRRILIEFTR